MKKSKYIGKIYEGRWKVVGIGDKHATLVNIFNEKEISIHVTSLVKVDRGKTTISKIICCRVNRASTNKTIKVVSQVRHRQFVYHKKLERGNL